MYMYYFLGYKLLSQERLSLSKKKLRAENTFLMALDGDVDFQPEAMQILVDRMKQTPELGAACGRIHPIGSGKTGLIPITESKVMSAYSAIDSRRLLNIHVAHFDNIIFYVFPSCEAIVVASKNVFSVLCQVPWCGTRSSSTQSLTGCKRRPNTSLVVFCAVRAVSPSSEALH
jgi:hypothetical protein